MKRLEFIPHHWLSPQLGELLLYTLGGDWGKDPSEKSNDEYSLVKVIRGTEIRDWSRFRAQNAATRMIKKNSLQQRSLKENDIIIEISGGGPDQPVGRVEIIDIETLRNETLPLICSNFFRKIRLGSHVNPKYIFFFLDYIYHKGYVDAYQTQTTNLRNLNFKRFLSGISVPFPSISEQDDIVVLIENMRGRTNRIRSRLEDIISKGDKIINNYFGIEDGAKMIPLADFIEESVGRIGGNWQSVEKIGVDNHQGIVPLRTGKKQSFEKYKIVTPGSFVYNPMRVNVGSIAYYEGHSICITSPDYIVFKIKHTISPRLLLKFLKSTQGIAQINKNTRGSVRSRLYFSSLKSISFPFYSDIKQQTEAESLLRGLDRFQEKKNIIETKLKESFYQYLAKAFMGQLTLSNSYNSPSKAILELIAEERLTFTTQNKMKSRSNSTDKKETSGSNLQELIMSHFKTKKFTAKELEDLSAEKLDLEYDEFREALFDLLRSPLNSKSNKTFLTQSLNKKNSTVMLQITK